MPLDSPAAIIDPDPMRIAAENPLQFFIQFAVEFKDPQPSLGATGVVRLSLVNSESIDADWTNDDGYRVRVLSNSTRWNGKPFTRELLAVSANDDIMAHLKDARYLRVHYKKNASEPLWAFNSWTVDLRHRTLNPKTWPSALEANDTYGAINEVMTCVRQHVGAVDPAVQARFNFETALQMSIDETNYDRTGLLNDLKDVGSFYCQVKQDIPWNSGKTYVGNLNDAIVYAGALWGRQRFASSEEASQSPLMTIDEITMRDIGMGDADRHLCPGWPGHPRSRG
jgi:hypothetical protein